jgi:hypothetical protein
LVAYDFIDEPFGFVGVPHVVSNMGIPFRELVIVVRIVLPNEANMKSGMHFSLFQVLWKFQSDIGTVIADSFDRIRSKESRD